MLLGIQEVMEAFPPDIVLSGINRGGNLGEDITYSGTVAAAIEGTLLGFPSVAFSQYSEDQQRVSWETAEKWIPRVLKKLFSFDWSSGVLMNVNFPSVPPSKVLGFEVARQGCRKIGGTLMEGKDPRGNKYYWIGPQRQRSDVKIGTDLNVVIAGGIAVTPLSVDLTHRFMLRAMKKSLL